MSKLYERLPEPVMGVVILYVCNELCDWTRCRLVNKLFYKACSDIFNTNYEEVLPSTSMVATNICMACDKTFTDRGKCYRVPFRGVPPPIYICCKSFYCNKSILRSMLKDADTNGVSLLLDEAVENMIGEVRRSNGTYQECVFANGWLWKDSFRIRCYFGENLYKDVPLSHIKTAKKFRVLKLCHL